MDCACGRTSTCTAQQQRQQCIANGSHEQGWGVRGGLAAGTAGRRTAAAMAQQQHTHVAGDASAAWPGRSLLAHTQTTHTWGCSGSAPSPPSLPGDHGPSAMSASAPAPAPEASLQPAAAAPSPPAVPACGGGIAASEEQAAAVAASGCPTSAVMLSCASGCAGGAAGGMTYIG